MNPIFPAKVNKKRVQMDEPEKFGNYLERYEGKRVAVVVKKLSQDRTLPQLRYYWGVVIHLLSQHTGYEPEEMHKVVKFKFLKAVTEKGDEYVRSLSTLIPDPLDTSMMTEYIEQIRRWAVMDLGVTIPDPDKVEA